MGKCIKEDRLQRKGGSSGGRGFRSLGNARLNKQQGFCSTLSGSFRSIVRLLHVRNFTLLFEASRKLYPGIAATAKAGQLCLLPGRASISLYMHVYTGVQAYQAGYVLHTACGKNERSMKIGKLLF